MPRFLLKIVLFLLPLLLVFAFPLFVYWKAREFTSNATAVQAQQGPQEVLYRLTYDNAGMDFKRVLINSRPDAKVLALGASRVGELRGFFFSPPGTFINGSGAIVGPEDWVSFIQNLATSSNIKIIILGTDANFFKPGATFNDTQQISPLDRVVSFLQGSWRQPYLDYFDRKFTLQSLIARSGSSPNIGLTALMENAGSMNDGSDLTSYTEISDPNRVAELEANVDANITTYREDPTSFVQGYGTTTDPQALAELQQFLAICKARNIYVIGFVPPFIPRLYQEMAGEHNAYTAEMSALPKTLKQTFSQYSFDFFDLSNPATASIKETEFGDEVHPTDKGMLRILIYMAEHDAKLRQYVNLPALRTLLQQTKGDFILTSA